MDQRNAHTYYSTQKVNAATNDKFAKMRLIKDRKRRFQAVWELAKARTLCEEDEKGTHGGCGQRQPVYRKEAFKLSAHFKSYRDDVLPCIFETVENKIILTDYMIKNRRTKDRSRPASFQ